MTSAFQMSPSDAYASPIKFRIGHRLELEYAAAEWVTEADAPELSLWLQAQWAGLARARGAARRAFEMALDYVKECQQFECWPVVFRRSSIS